MLGKVSGIGCMCNPRSISAYKVCVESLRDDGGAGRAALIVNTRSRSGERTFFEALDRLEEMGVSLGATYAIRDPVRLPETVREVLHEGSDYRLLILGGGDGSVSSVVDFLANHRIVLGLLPLGTANDFARTLEIPADVEKACETIVKGKVVDVDLGLAGDNYYVNVASVRSEEHTSELQSRQYLVCRLLLERKPQTACPLRLRLSPHRASTQQPALAYS